MNRRKSECVIISVLIISAFLLLGTNISMIRQVQAADTYNIDKIVAHIPRVQGGDNETDWTSPQYKMLLITPPDFVSAAQELATWKTQRGISTVVVSNYSAYAGVDTPEKIRNAIKAYYEAYDIEWVLLMGDTTLIPVRYIYNPDGEILHIGEAVGSSTLKPTDFYYAELTADWNIDGDLNWGEDIKYNSVSEESEMDFLPEVYVGRLPADNAAELSMLINKTIFYEKAMNIGVWMNRFLAASGISDYSHCNEVSCDLDGEDEARLNQYIIDNYIDSTMDWRHAEQHTSYYTPPADVRISNLFSTTLLASINDGCSIAVWAGHGTPGSFDAQGFSALTTENVNALTNTNKFALLVGDACSTNSYDANDNSIGESFIKRQFTGGIGYIGSMRISWYYPNDTYLEWLNRGVTKQLFYEMFVNHYYQQGKALYESKRSYAEGNWVSGLPSNFPYIETERKIITSYMLLGDPSVDIYTDLPNQFAPLPLETDLFYEGEKQNIIILDNESQPVPYATLAIYSSDGKYHAFTADLTGKIYVDMPAGVRNYNYTLSAHNMIYKPGNFTVLPDTTLPQFLSAPQMTPEHPTIDDNPHVKISAIDNESGIKDGYVLISQNDFQSFEAFPLFPTETDCEYCVDLPKLDYGEFKAALVLFDNAENYNTTLYPGQIQQFQVPTPFQPMLLAILSYAAITMAGVIAILGWKKLKKNLPQNTTPNEFIVI